MEEERAAVGETGHAERAGCNSPFSIYFLKFKYTKNQNSNNCK
jgi:hypothetical protein